MRNTETANERFAFDAEIVAVATHREFVGFNRARHALLEAAIFATRFHLLPPEEIEREFEKLTKIIGKTGDEPEKSAMAELYQAFARFREGGTPP